MLACFPAELGCETRGCELASGLYHRWSLLCNNNMATNLQRFTSNNGRRGGVFRMWLLNASGYCSETVTAASGKARNLILCEEKHEW